MSRDQGRSGAAMTASGGVLAGTGLLAGGVPGAREPNSLKVWHLKGNPRSKELVSRSNMLHNAKIVAPFPRAGILGFRADMHDKFIQETKDTLGPWRPHEPAARQAALEAEHKIVRGMRAGRRASYGLTAAGALLAANGVKRSREVGKRDRDRGAALGTTGAAAGGTTGAVVGLKGGVEAGAKLVNARIDREYPRHLPRPRGDLFPRQLKAVNRGGKSGALLGASVLGAGGYRLARGGQVDKRDRDNVSAAALGGGATVAGVSQAANIGLSRFGRKYGDSSKKHVLDAERLAPHFGGLERTKEKSNDFGVVTKPSRTTLRPVRQNWELNASGAYDKIKHAPTRDKVAAHRSTAAQERHFAEVFNSTARGFKRVRNPALAVAGAGAAGLWAADDVRKATRVYGYQERSLSPVRTTEAAAGLALGAWGVSRMRGLNSLAAYGARIAEANGAGPEAAKALEAARKLAESTRRQTGRGEKAIRSNARLNAAIEAVPAAMRPAVATTAGALLVTHAHPVHNQRFHRS